MRKLLACIGVLAGLAFGMNNAYCQDAFDWERRLKLWKKKHREAQKESGFEKQGTAVRIVKVGDKQYKLHLNTQDYYNAKRRRRGMTIDHNLAEFTKTNDPYLKHILRSYMNIPSGDRERDAQLILDFVHGFPYENDIDDYQKTPIETMFEGGGDCEDLSTLCVSMMRAAGIEANYILIPPIWFLQGGHVLVGVPGDFEGAYVKLKGRKFYLAETTGTLWPDEPTTWQVGDLPKSLADSYDVTVHTLYFGKYRGKEILVDEIKRKGFAQFAHKGSFTKNGVKNNFKSEIIPSKNSIVKVDYDEYSFSKDEDFSIDLFLNRFYVGYDWLQDSKKEAVSIGLNDKDISFKGGDYTVYLKRSSISIPTKGELGFSFLNERGAHAIGEGFEARIYNNFEFNDFRSTKHFSINSNILYLEMIGTRFGAFVDYNLYDIFGLNRNNSGYSELMKKKLEQRYNLEIGGVMNLIKEVKLKLGYEFKNKELRTGIDVNLE